MNKLNLINTSLGLILVYAATLIAFGIFILVGFFKGLPKELEEAAAIDGASYFSTFFRVMLPPIAAWIGYRSDCERAEYLE